jgi:hypothetical protein
MNALQITSPWTGGPSPRGVDPAIGAAAAVVNGGGDQGLDQQLQAYQSLAAHWGQAAASPGDRATLSQALTQSPFARRVEGALNSFTKAAWPGEGAAPDQAQAKMLQAFDALSPDDQKIVFTVQTSVRGRPAFASVEDYRASLQPARGVAPTDTITLSPEAQARLAAGEEPPPAAPAPGAPLTTPQSLAMAQATKAYASARG